MNIAQDWPWSSSANRSYAAGSSLVVPISRSMGHNAGQSSGPNRRTTIAMLAILWQAPSTRDGFPSCATGGASSPHQIGPAQAEAPA
jgi:hypothetical protein